jgi:hypothetical protein
MGLIGVENKIKVAFIYRADYAVLSGQHYDNTYYHFFMNALRRNKRLDVKYFPTESEFDASILRNNFDIILLCSNASGWRPGTTVHSGMPDEINGIQELDIPVIAKSADPADSKMAIKNHKRWKIDHYFNFYSEPFIHELYPSNFKYKTIIFGIERSLYQNVKPFKKRIKNKILNSGAVGNTKFISKFINDIRNPKWNTYSCYKLRTKCNELPFVDYTSTLKHEFIGDKYPLLLQKYAAAIAASTYSPCIKYWEIPAAGCLTFMEITDKNKGEYVGFEDGKTAVFMDEDNCKLRFKQYLSEPDNPKWERIAEAGRIYSLENFNNDKAVSHLIDLMESLCERYND